MQLSYGEKLFLKKFLVTSLQFIIVNTLWYTLYLFDLYSVYDNVLYNLYYTYLTFFTLLTIYNIGLSILYFNNKNNYINEISYREWYDNHTILRYDFKILINIFLYLFGIIISIYSYSSQAFFKLPIYSTIQLIIISIASSIFLLSLIIFFICTFFSRNNLSSNRIVNNRVQPIINNYIINISNPTVPCPVQNLSLENITVSTNTLCSICLDEENSSENWVKLSCEHKYHKLCIEKWLITNLTCPLCRREVINLV